MQGTVPHALPNLFRFSLDDVSVCDNAIQELATLNDHVIFLDYYSQSKSMVVSIPVRTCTLHMIIIKCNREPTYLPLSIHVANPSIIKYRANAATRP